VLGAVQELFKKVRFIYFLMLGDEPKMHKLQIAYLLQTVEFSKTLTSCQIIREL
jgi:hypothetical protein